jgi:flagellar motor switch protein FliN
MSNTPGPNSDSDFNLDDFGADLDPFADSEAGAGGEAAGDPFDFGAAESTPTMDAPKGGKAAVAKKPAAKASKAPVSPAPSAPKASGAARNAGLAADVPVQVVAVMGKKTITVRDLVDMKKGQVVELNRFPNEAIDLVANGKLMAKGELVEIDGKLGVRIIKIFE